MSLWKGESLNPSSRSLYKTKELIKEVTGEEIKKVERFYG
jgi:hypothetical protein